MKKFAALSLFAALLLSLAACGAEKTAETPAPSSTPVMEVVIPVGTPAPTAEPSGEPENARLRSIMPELDTIDSAYCLVTFLSAPSDEVKEFDVPDEQVAELMALVRAADLDECEYAPPESGAVDASGFWNAYDYNMVLSLADSSVAGDGWYMYMLLIREGANVDVCVARTDGNGRPTAYHLFTAPPQEPLLALGDYVFTGAGMD